MLRIAICDDIVSICSELEDMILEFGQKNNQELTVEVFYRGEDILKYLNDGNSFDLIFLDIELGKLDGVEIGRIIREELEDYITKIIYISAKGHYDRQLFDVQPLHFLQKPLEKEKVFKDISLAIKILDRTNNYFMFKLSHETHKLPIKDIIYFESIDKQIKLVGVDETIYFYDNLYRVLDQVFKFRFIQTHRSYIVNYDHISIVKYNEFIMINGDVIPISQGRRKKIRNIQMLYEKEVL
ncbi:LytR/AlgR family response regulator transcription factor [Tissierella creatinophila]|uniref:Transcriptional regulatory protein YpdB n=1 Tax=Tissierella creatinophila DSM 6911 TaxID=1123403 RepID=A0A1U7M3Z3_TISCR|nr:LytTR family DNA-binding domain-containing protein [Tissierella creatinophila]OLS02037.1 transcriptional regulatory protein YpdB [Tissierella creatinophila DSM 6911]